MASQKQFILTPVGRLVAGSLYKAQTTDMEGRPLIVKNGPQAGQPRSDFFFAIAIPKGGEQHWSQTPWGKTIWETGHAAFPQGQGSQSFAWKIIDGDSAIPNSTGKRPCDREGYAGHWVLHWSSGFAPKVYTADGTKQIPEEDAVKLGYFIQVHGSVDGNGSSQKPGIYLNHSMVALAGYGPEIVLGPDAAAVGFGKGVALPPGASATPPAGAFNPVQPAVAPALPVLPAMPAVATVAPALPVLPGVPSPVVVQPHPQFLQVPTVPAVPAVPVGRTLTAKANGATYEQLVASGWTDELLRANGLML
jgi:hypothetical protein